MKLNIYVIGASQTRTDSLDGSTRILIECAKRWIRRGHQICVLTCEEGYEIFQKYGLTDVDYVVIRSSAYKRLGIFILYLIRTIKLCALLTKLRPKGKNIVVYSGSDFLPDSIPTYIFNMRFQASRWVAGFYLFAPRPFDKNSPYKGKKILKGLLYYLSQIPAFRLVRNNADMVWVTNEIDRWKFIDWKRLTPDRVVAVRGGVDTVTPTLIPEPEKKRFDAVYVGRFHPQKGVLELIDIWKLVCERKPDAKLAMIGVGELEKEVKKKIMRYHLGNNIVLFGFKDGIKKTTIFKESRVVVHPAIYDSGGMAPCEAMACGLPGVSFDLPALRTYYPKGMIKTRCYDLKEFAENILKLLNYEGLYTKTAKDALDLAREWDWDTRAQDLIEAMKNLFLD